jgi:hypothetical protein
MYNYMDKIKNTRTSMKNRFNLIARIMLNPTNTVLVGQYEVNAPIVIVILDSSDQAFAIELPPLNVSVNNMFFFYNIPVTGSGNNVTVSSTNINNSGSVVIEPFAGAIVVDGLNGKYVAMKGV